MDQPKTRAEIENLADIFRQRAAAGWTTTLSPETTLLVAHAFEMYVREPPEIPRRQSPDDRLQVDMFDKGSAIYKLATDDSILKTVAWAENSLVAHRAFDALVEQYPGDHFRQKRGAWVER